MEIEGVDSAGIRVKSFSDVNATPHPRFSFGRRASLKRNPGNRKGKANFDISGGISGNAHH